MSVLESSHGKGEYVVGEKRSSSPTLRFNDDGVLVARSVMDELSYISEALARNGFFEGEVVVSVEDEEEDLCGVFTVDVVVSPRSPPPRCFLFLLSNAS
jgi:hypothetical protein